jgi:prephenate dehydrogenase (NADP+)
MGEAVVGLIGMGDMGKMYARRLSEAGWRYALALCITLLV